MLLLLSYEYQNNTNILQGYYFQISLSLSSGESWQKSDEGGRAGGDGGGAGGEWKERLRQDSVILKSDDPQYHDCKCQITSNQNLPEGIKCQVVAYFPLNECSRKEIPRACTFGIQFGEKQR